MRNFDNSFDLAQFDAEFEEAEVREPGSFEEVPPGTYQAVVKDYDIKTSQAGNPTFALQFKILGPRYKGRVVFRNYVLNNPKVLSILKGDLATMGLAGVKPSQLPVRGAELVDTPVEIKIDQKADPKDRGKVYTNVYVNKVLDIDPETVAQLLETRESAGATASSGGGVDVDDIPF